MTDFGIKPINKWSVWNWADVFWFLALFMLLELIAPNTVLPFLVGFNIGFITRDIFHYEK